MEQVSFDSFICFFPVGGENIIYNMNTKSKKNTQKKQQNW